MNWTDLPCNELLRRVFIQPPKVGAIDLLEVQIKSDGPAVIIGFDLVGVLPDNPPTKWGSDFNRCRMGIYCLGVSNLSIEGLARNMIANVNFHIFENVNHVEVKGEFFKMNFDCADISITGPSVYIS